jgi:uncharacterized protein (DUF2236 family)
MMFGGMFMMLFGLIALILVIAVPAALIGVLAWALTRNGNTPRSATTLVPAQMTSQKACTNCGAALQPGWNHCAQCGAPVN